MIGLVLISVDIFINTGLCTNQAVVGLINIFYFLLIIIPSILNYKSFWFFFLEYTKYLRINVLR